MTDTDRPAASFWDELEGNDFRRVPAGEKGAGSPLIIPPGGGEPVAYKRATSYIAVAEDDYGIHQWKRHLTVDGVLDNLSTTTAEWATADWHAKVSICDAAFHAAGGHVKADNGTHMHGLTDALDKGEPYFATEAQNNDLVAYREAVQPFTLVHAEVKVVNDDLGVAGTPDRVWEYQGRHYIGDLKTGKIDARKCAMQTALYAHSRLYDVATGKRTDLDVDLERALIVHLPYGEAKARVLWVDIAAGWEGVQLCAAIHAWRKRNGMSKVFTPPAVDYVVLAAQADSVQTLTALYERAVAADAWNHMVRNAFTLRKQQLTAVAAA